MIETEVSCITSVRGICQRVQTSKHLLCMIEDNLGKEWSHICMPRLHHTQQEVIPVRDIEEEKNTR